MGCPVGRAGCAAAAPGPSPKPHSYVTGLDTTLLAPHSPVVVWWPPHNWWWWRRTARPHTAQPLMVRMVAPHWWWWHRTAPDGAHGGPTLHTAHHVHHEGRRLAAVLAVRGRGAQVKHGGPRLVRRGMGQQRLAAARRAVQQHGARTLQPAAGSGRGREREGVRGWVGQGACRLHDWVLTCEHAWAGLHGGKHRPALAIWRTSPHPALPQPPPSTTQGAHLPSAA